jgi:carbonic anhydrase/acetyltransferase-like protein (isoleucine patch superfamily)
MEKSSNTSIRPNSNGDYPNVHPTAYIDPTAQLIGNVRIGPECFVGPNAVIRADETDHNGKVHPIEIGAQCNVQDAVIIHALAGTKVTVGPQTSLAHACIIHGPCTIGQNCFIGFRAVIYKSSLADGVFINTAAIVQGVDLAENILVPPAAAILSNDDIPKLKITSSTERQFAEKIITANLTLTKGYMARYRDEFDKAM